MGKSTTYKRKHKALGLCASCPAPQTPGSIYCQKHKAARAVQEKQRRRRVRGGDLRLKKIKSPDQNYAGWKRLKWRCSTLGISPQELAAVESINQFRGLVKTKYRDLARKNHPDLGGSVFDETNGRTRFDRITRTYHFLMGLSEGDIRRALVVRQSVPDPELPLDWGGWEAWDKRYTNFQIWRHMP